MAGTDSQVLKRTLQRARAKTGQQFKEKEKEATLARWANCKGEPPLVTFGQGLQRTILKIVTSLGPHNHLAAP